MIKEEFETVSFFVLKQFLEHFLRGSPLNSYSCDRKFTTIHEVISEKFRIPVWVEIQCKKRDKGMYMNKAPPKKARAQAKSSSPHQLVARPKPSQPAKATKSKTQMRKKQKTRQLVKCNWRVFKDLWSIAYQDAQFFGRGGLWITVRYHEELIHIALLLIVFFLEYRIHAIPLFHH